ncbi:MAG: hypothetical protein WCK47_08580 [bacterium]|nr:hypothetical protein [Candidatus Sumerlaeota bacterium]
MSEIMAHVFLGCFLVGFILAAVSLIFGFDSLHHIHFGGHDGFQIDSHGGVDSAHAGGGGHGMHIPQVPFFSYNGILMFITWFGGVGYVLNTRANAALLVTLLGAVAAGFIGAAAVFYFLGKFLLRGQTRMNPADYYLPGTLARVSSPIRQGGVGEIVYVQGGTRKTTGARSEENMAHKQGEEVVIVRYEKGIAYVKTANMELE